jgi:hypothetical protein
VHNATHASGIFIIILAAAAATTTTHHNHGAPILFPKDTSLNEDVMGRDEGSYIGY